MLKNEFEQAVVNELSVFEPLKICYTFTVKSLNVGTDRSMTDIADPAILSGSTLLAFKTALLNKTWPRGKKYLSSPQLSTKFFRLVNVKIPTIVVISTFLSRKNSVLGLSEPEKCLIFLYSHTYEHLNFHAQLS